MIWMALLFASAAASPSARTTTDTCVAPRIDTRDWPIAESARLPGLVLRLPPDFARDSAEDRYVVPTGSGSRWANDFDQIIISFPRTDSSALTPFTIPPDREESSRCEERLGDASALILSYRHIYWSGDGYLGPYHIRARIYWPGGRTVEAIAVAKDRTRLENLLGAVRTIRHSGSAPPSNP